MAHHASSSVHSSRKLWATRGFFCSRGLKEGLFFDDVEKRVFRSTCRATHHLLASIAGASPLDDLSRGAHSPPSAEKLTHLEEGIDAPQGSVCILEDVACRVQQDFSYTGHCNAQIYGKFDGFDGSKLLSSHPGASSLHSSECVPKGYAPVTTLGLHISNLEIQEPHGVSKFCIGYPEAPSTPDLQPELNSWDYEGLHKGNAKNRFCTVENVCKNDDDHRDSVVLEENDIGMAGCSIKRFDALIEQNEVVCTDDNFLFGSSCSSFVCWRGANTNHSLQKWNFRTCKGSRLWKVFNYLVTSSVDICDTPSKQKLVSQSSSIYGFRLILHKLVRLQKRRQRDWEVGVLGEQLMAYTHIYLRVCRSRKGQRASCYFRRFLRKQDPFVEKRVGRYKKVNLQIIVEHNRKYHLSEKRNHVLLKCLLLEDNISGFEQAAQCTGIPSSMVCVDSGSWFSYISEARDEGIQRSTESSSSEFKSNSRILQGSPEYDDDESDQSSHCLLSEVSIDSASKLPNLFEARDGGCTESSCEEELSGFLSWRSAKNKVDDWISLSPEQVDECLDSCLYNLQHHPTSFPHNLTPEMKLLDLVVRSNPSKFANSPNDGLVDEGSQTFDVYANGNENNVSCLPEDGSHDLTPSQCIASLSFNGEKLRSSMPYKGVHERQGEEKLKHFAESFLLRRHITRQQQRAQQAPPFPPRDSAGSVYKYPGASGKPLGDVRANQFCSMTVSLENNNDLAMISTASPKHCNVAPSFCDHDCLVGADVVIDIVGLMKYIESQCSQVMTFTDAASISTNYRDMPLIGGQVVISNFSVVIVTIIAIVVYTRTLLEGGLAWVGARTQKEEDN